MAAARQRRNAWYLKSHGGTRFLCLPARQCSLSLVSPVTPQHRPNHQHHPHPSPSQHSPPPPLLHTHTGFLPSTYGKPDKRPHRGAVEEEGGSQEKKRPSKDQITGGKQKNAWLKRANTIQRTTTSCLVEVKSIFV